LTKGGIVVKPAKKNLAVFCALLLALVMAAPAAAEYADYKGHKVFYKVMGQGEPALVLVHCWNGNHTLWRYNAPQLAKKHKLVLVDILGHGKSDKPKVDYTLDFMAGGVAAAIKASGVNKPVLAGHSMGGPVSRTVIRNNPGLASGLILVDSAIYPLPKDPKIAAARLKVFDLMIASLKKDFKGNLPKMLAPMLGPSMKPEAKKLLVDTMLAADPYVSISCLKTMRDPKSWQFKPLKMKTMAQVARNPYYPPDVEKQMREFFPNLVFKQWDKVGHWIQLEKPELFNRQVLEYLEK
jgi:pimeloyl-ACP methyl ester carboxylesterase